MQLPPHQYFALWWEYRVGASGIHMYRKIFFGLIAASSLSLLAASVRADGETWCKIADPNDTYVNKRFPANGRITGSFDNGMNIWVDPGGTVMDGKGRRWAAVFRNDRSGRTDYVLARFTYDCNTCSRGSCSPIRLDD